ncbi:siderophore-interacting protein [Amycolatopsis sp. NPDC023774]|uniref:siderophore-interacting protein n=1 Tax=Amycolatopsis sp. NPDC023774 TaxID=3155015 RepID=UPI0033C2FCC7
MARVTFDCATLATTEGFGPDAYLKVFFPLDDQDEPPLPAPTDERRRGVLVPVLPRDARRGAAAGAHLHRARVPTRCSARWTSTSCSTTTR